MDRRKKRTSTNQYMMYIDMMENDRMFATGRVPRDGDQNYLAKKWKLLSDKLNTCAGGPRLTAEEWRKRLNDWKNTTRCKYRRSVSGEKDVTLTSLEKRALDLFGTAPNVNLSPDQLSLHLKCEKSDKDETEDDMENQRTSEAFQKELQAAVEEAIGGDDDEEEEEVLGEDPDESEEVLSDPIGTSMQNAGEADGEGDGSGNTTTYRTIVVENAHYTDDDNNEEHHLEFITPRRHTLGGANATSTASVQTSMPSAVTKLINGDIPLKRLRSQAPEPIIYEGRSSNGKHAAQFTEISIFSPSLYAATGATATVKKANPQPVQQQPRTITIHNPGVSMNAVHHHAAPAVVPHVTADTAYTTAANSAQASAAAAAAAAALSTQDVREIGRQLRRIADIKTEKLKFEIARYKFNNPGFQFNATL